MAFSEVHCRRTDSTLYVVTARFMQDGVYEEMTLPLTDADSPFRRSMWPKQLVTALYISWTGGIAEEIAIDVQFGFTCARTADSLDDETGKVK